MMQGHLFNANPVEVDLDRDPYEEQRVVARRIAASHGIEEAEAFELMLAYGSEVAVLRELKQRWWRGEIDHIDEQAA